MMTPKEKKNLEKLLKGWLFYLPLILCVLLMLPRLLSPQFGLFDDGKTIIAAKEMAKNLSYFTFEADEGRFRPIYWLYFSTLNWIFGENPFWFFLGNTVLLVIATWLLMVFTQMVTGRRTQTWIAGLFFVLSGPVIENYYTLSKGFRFIPEDYVTRPLYRYCRQHIKISGIFDLPVINICIPTMMKTHWQDNPSGVCL